MTISAQNIIDAALESLEWRYQQNELHAHDIASTLESINEDIHEAINGALIYTSDIVDYWRENGMPEPEDDYGQETIRDAITWAVYEHLRDAVSDWDVLEAFVESHAGTLETIPDAPDSNDTEAALVALIEYRETL